MSDDLQRCSIHSWFPSLKNSSIRTTLIPLDAAFVKYLLADGVRVPDVGDESDGSGFSDEDETAADDNEEEAAASSFPELEEKITAAIRRHGGAIFPKLNWSAPTDAAWVLGGSTKCASARDVLLLLKSSDRVAHDLCDARSAYDDGEDAESNAPTGGEPDDAGDDGNFAWTLALRRWCNLRPSSEFRCFSVEHGAHLVAACQRDRSTYYPFLDALRPRLLELLESFALRTFGEGPDAPLLPSRVVWDAYVDAEEKVHLIDVAPFHKATDPIVFEWEELFARAEEAEAHALAEEAGGGGDGGGGSQGCEVTFSIRPALGGGVCADLRVSEPPGGASAIDAASSGPPPELRLVPPLGIAPSSTVYHGWPTEVQGLALGGGEVGQLLDAARRAAASDGQ